MRKLLFFLIAIPIVLLILALFFIFPFLNRRELPTTTLPTVTPIKLIREPSPPETNKIPPLEKDGLIQKLPYSTGSFDIEYLAISDEFILTIKESPYEQNKNKAINWFVENGIDPTRLRILYNKYRWVQ